MGKRAVVIYQSKYGSTKQYAEWIGGDLPADIVPLEAADEKTLAGRELIIVGGWIRVGRLTCADFIVRHWDALKGKSVVVFSTSATRPTDPLVQDFFRESFPSDIAARLHFFPLWGRFTRVDMADKFLMLAPRTALYVKLLLAPDEKTKSRYQGLAGTLDHVERSALEPLLRFCRAALASAPRV